MDFKYGIILLSVVGKAPVTTAARGITNECFSGLFCRTFEIIIFCFVVALFDLV